MRIKNVIKINVDIPTNIHPILSKLKLYKNKDIKVDIQYEAEFFGDVNQLVEATFKLWDKIKSEVLEGAKPLAANKI